MNHGENNVSNDVTAGQDKIAQDMWVSYQRVLEAREGNESGNEDEEDASEEEDDNFAEEMFYEDNNFLMI